MTPIFPDLRRIAAVSAVLCIIVYTIICLGFDIPPTLMPLKIGIIAFLVGLFWWYFDKHGWHQRLLRLGGWLCDLPDLNGRWEGTVDRLGENDPHPFVLEVRQTFLRIQLHAYSKNSRGNSITAQFVTDHVHGRFSLISTWQSRTKNRANPNEMDEFLGTSVYEIVEDGADRYLEDFYYTRRNPQTKGKTRLKFVTRTLRNSL